MRKYIIDYLILGSLDNGNTLSIIRNGQLEAKLSKTTKSIDFIRQRIIGDFIMSRSEPSKAEITKISVAFTYWNELDE